MPFSLERGSLYPGSAASGECGEFHSAAIAPTFDECFLVPLLPPDGPLVLFPSEEKYKAAVRNASADLEEIYGPVETSSKLARTNYQRASLARTIAIWRQSHERLTQPEQAQLKRRYLARFVGRCIF